MSLKKKALKEYHDKENGREAEKERDLQLLVKQVLGVSCSPTGNSVQIDGLSFRLVRDGGPRPQLQVKLGDWYTIDSLYDLGKRLERGC